MATDALHIGSVEYLPAKVVGKRFGYTSAYMLLLAKQGKVNGKKIGARWYIDPQSVAIFVKQSEVARESRSEAIREERKRELKVHAKKLPRVAPRKSPEIHTKALLETFAILVIGLVIGATGYLGTAATTQQANVSDSGIAFFERLAVALYDFISPLTEETIDTQSVNSIAISDGFDNQQAALPTTSTTTHTSLVIGPDEVMTTTTIDGIRSSFSDEVSVSVDPNNPDTGLIVPHFKDRDGEAYRFLMVPVNTPGG